MPPKPLSLLLAIIIVSSFSRELFLIAKLNNQAETGSKELSFKSYNERWMPLNIIAIAIILILKGVVFFAIYKLISSSLTSTIDSFLATYGDIDDNIFSYLLTTFYGTIGLVGSLLSLNENRFRTSSTYIILLAFLSERSIQGVILFSSNFNFTLHRELHSLFVFVHLFSLTSLIICLTSTLLFNDIRLLRFIFTFDLEKRVLKDNRRKRKK